LQHPPALRARAKRVPQGIGDQSPARLGDVKRRVAEDLARDGRVEHDRGNACRQGLERREAEAFVLRKERKDGRAFVQSPQLAVVHPAPDPNATRQGGLGECAEVECRVCAVGAHDLEPQVGAVRGKSPEAVE